MGSAHQRIELKTQTFFHWVKVNWLLFCKNGFNFVIPFGRWKCQGNRKLFGNSPILEHCPNCIILFFVACSFHSQKAFFVDIKARAEIKKSLFILEFFFVSSWIVRAVACMREIDVRERTDFIGDNLCDANNIYWKIIYRSIEMFF